MPGCGPILHTTTASATDGVDLQEQKRSSDKNSFEPLCCSMRVAIPNGKLFSGADSVAEWMGKIKKVWARGSSSTLDLARVVSAAKNRLQQHYGQWSRLWKSEHKMPFSKSTADRLATIGDRMGWLDSATSLNLPRGWNILFCLAPLDRQTLEQLIEQGFIHPKLTLREAKEFVARLRGKPTEAGTRKANVRRWLRRSAEFVRDTVSDWEIDERELATEQLTRLIEQIRTPGGMALMPNGDCLNFITQCNLLTDQQNTHP